MTCEQFDDLRNSGHGAEAALPQSAREHLQNCERCRQLQVFWDSAAVPGEIAPELQARIAQRIIAGLRPVSPLPSNRVLIALLLSLTAVTVAIGVWWLGQDGWQALAPLQSGIVFSLLGAGIFLIAYVVTSQMTPGSRQRIAPATTIVGVSLSLLIATLLLFRYRPDPDFVKVGLTCWERGLLVATGAAVLYSLVLRRGAWLSPIKLGAATGCLAGLTGLSVLEIYCPNLDRRHIGVWHLGAALTATLIGVAIPAIGVTFRRRNHTTTS